jgi:hypothetical protein
MGISLKQMSRDSWPLISDERENYNQTILNPSRKKTGQAIGIPLARVCKPSRIAYTRPKGWNPPDSNTSGVHGMTLA